MALFRGDSPTYQGGKIVTGRLVEGLPFGAVAVVKPLQRLSFEAQECLRLDTTLKPNAKGRLMLNEDRICELLAEAEADLASYDALRENTLEIIKTYKKRLDLLGSKGRAMILPGVELPMPPKSEKTEETAPRNEGLSNKALFEAVLAKWGPLKAKEVWPRAVEGGAKSTSSNPIRTTDSILREMVKQGRLVQVGPGEFAVKPQ